MSTSATIPAPADLIHSDAAPPSDSAAWGVTASITPRLPGVSDTRLLHAYAECQRLTQRVARNFYYGLRLTPEPRRSAVYSIYAWMRTADDQVDAAGTSADRRARLAQLRDTTELVLSGRAPLNDLPPFWLAFAATIASYPIDHAFIRSMLDGLSEDLDHAGYADRRDLDRYCYRVGSTVGLTCIAIWGLRSDAKPAPAAAMATRRGKAFQLTNILRDIGQDFRDTPRRVYIPAADLAAKSLSPEDLAAWRYPDRCRALVLELAALAREHYRASDGLESLIDPDCAPAMWGMTRIYAELLDVIERDPAAVVGPRRVRLSSARKGLIALSALVRKRTQTWPSP